MHKQATEQEAPARAQVTELRSQVGELKAAMATQERKRVVADAAQNEAEQSRQCLEAKCQALHNDYAGKLLPTRVWFSFSHHVDLYLHVPFKVYA